MTQEETNQPNKLGEWWEQCAFDSKAQYSLDNSGVLSVCEYADYKARTVGNITEDNPDMVFNLLVEKYPEVAAKVTELTEEWGKEQDKLQLVGKVERIKEYLKHVSAIGDIHGLYKTVDTYEVELNKLIDENFTKKEELTKKAEAHAVSENWKEATALFKQIADEWKNIGYLDRHRNDELWKKVEAAKDKFYERKREHTEDINKEMLQNLDLKMEVVEKAEALAASEEWRKATDALKALMEQWKGIGRTMHDKNEELWKRFTEANNVFFERKKAHYEVIHKEQDENLKAKEELVELAEALKDKTDWNETTDAYKLLMDEWKKTGRVAKEKSDEIWNRFNAARDHFFNKKRESFEAYKLSMEDNYAQKMALLKRAEALQDSTQWRETTEEINELMDEWKKIGPVPRKHSNEIWERFIGARKKFYERKDANREKRKHIYEQREKERVQNTYNFADKIKAEIREEEEKLVDFKDGLQNIDPKMKKADELKAHLTKLIEQTEKKIEHKKEKLIEADKQIKELEAKEEKKEQDSDSN